MALHGILAQRFALSHRFCLSPEESFEQKIYIQRHTLHFIAQHWAWKILILRVGFNNDSSKPSRRFRFQDIFCSFASSLPTISFVLNFVALFIVFGVSKFSGAWKSIQDFFYYYFLLYLVFAWFLSCSLISFLRCFIFFFGKILFNVHEKAMQSDFFSPSSF